MIAIAAIYARKSLGGLLATERRVRSGLVVRGMEPLLGVPGANGYIVLRAVGERQINSRGNVHGWHRPVLALVRHLKTRSVVLASCETR